MPEIIGLPTIYNKSSIKAYWKMEDVNATVWWYNLTNNNTVWFNSAKFWNGADFWASNTNKYLSLASDVVWTHLNCTFSLWIKVTTQPWTNATNWLFNLRTNASSNYIDWCIRYIDTSWVKSLFFNRSKAWVADQWPSVNVDLWTSLWHHIAMTYNWTNIRGYIDWVCVTGDYAASWIGSGWAASANIWSTATTTHPFSWIIDDFVIFTSTLTDAEILEIYKWYTIWTRIWSLWSKLKV